MAKFCGGIRLDSETLKTINGIICDVNATSVISTVWSPLFTTA